MVTVAKRDKIPDQRGADSRNAETRRMMIVTVSRRRGSEVKGNRDRE
jgi:hypothetical protein